MQIIKDRKVAENQWHHLDDGVPAGDGNTTVSLARWKTEKDSLKKRHGNLGLRITSGDSIDEFADSLNDLDIICLDFPVFADGRLFSTAHILRGRYGYKGELRAIGNFIRDQIFFLSRVGVNSFELRNLDDPAEALNALDDFTVKYQGSSDTVAV